MSYFIIPQSWIAPAIAAAAGTFGSLGHSVDIKYRNLPGQALGEARPPHTIVIDKRPNLAKPQAQCLIVHEYGHLRGYHDDSNTDDPAHSANPRSIMYPVLSAPPCLRWLARHGL